MIFNFKDKLFQLIILGIIHLLFFFTKLYIGDFFLQDSLEYYQLAENIKNQFSFYSGDLNATINFEDYTKRPPLYAFFILISSFLLKSKTAILLAQNALSFFSITFTYSLFKEHLKNVNIKLYFLLVMTSTGQFVYANYIMSEIFLQFLIIILCYCFYKTIKTKSLKYIFYTQFIIILLFLTKPVFYLFIIPNIIICIWLTKQITNKAFLLSFIPIIALLFYLTWNYHRTGSYEFSSIQNINLKNYNLKYFHTNKYGEDYALQINNEISNKADATLNYQKRQQIIRTTAIKYLKKDFINYTWFHVKGSLRMFLDPGRFDLYNFFDFKNKNEVGFLFHINKGGFMGAFNYFKQQPIIILILLPLILIFNIIKAIGFVLFWSKNYKATTPFLLYCLFIIMYIAALTGPLGASRFLVPIIPLYCMFSALGFSGKINILKTN